MNSPRTFLIDAAAIVALLLLLPAAAYAQQAIETSNRAGIKLSYIPAAKLNEIELRQVLALAQKVGITNVAEVKTDYSLPTRSSERAAEKLAVHAATSLCVVGTTAMSRITR